MIVMFSVAFFRIIEAIAYLDDKHKINDLAGSVFESKLWTAGVWDLCIAVVAVFAGWSLLTGGGFGRVVGYIWAVLVMVQSFMIVAFAPWFAVTMIALAALVIYGLASTAAKPRATEPVEPTWRSHE